MSDPVSADGRNGAPIPADTAPPDGAVAWDHHALLYEDDDALADSVAEFLSDGYRLGDPLVVLSTRSRRDALIRRFAANGLDWQEALRSRRLQWMDAQAALKAITIDRIPDADLFRRYIGSMIQAGLDGGAGGDGDTGPRVRAYGELVDLLWQDGDDLGALLLEDLWNDLGRTYALSLLCAYSRGNLYRESGRRSWSEVCQRHARVRIPHPRIHPLEAADAPAGGAAPEDASPRRDGAAPRPRSAPPGAD